LAQRDFNHVLANKAYGLYRLTSAILQESNVNNSV
jgi:hypothetical protein